MKYPAFVWRKGQKKYPTSEIQYRKQIRKLVLKFEATETVIDMRSEISGRPHSELLTSYKAGFGKTWQSLWTSVVTII